MNTYISTIINYIKEMADGMCGVNEYDLGYRNALKEVKKYLLPLVDIKDQDQKINTYIPTRRKNNKNCLNIECTKHTENCGGYCKMIPIEYLHVCKGYQFKSESQQAKGMYLQTPQGIEEMSEINEASKKEEKSRPEWKPYKYLIEKSAVKGEAIARFSDIYNISQATENNTEGISELYEQIKELKYIIECDWKARSEQHYGIDNKIQKLESSIKQLENYKSEMKKKEKNE